MKIALDDGIASVMDSTCGPIAKTYCKLCDIVKYRFLKYNRFQDAVARDVKAELFMDKQPQLMANSHVRLNSTQVNCRDS